MSTYHAHLRQAQTGDGLQRLINSDALTLLHNLGKNTTMLFLNLRSWNEHIFEKCVIFIIYLVCVFLGGTWQIGFSPWVSDECLSECNDWEITATLLHSMKTHTHTYTYKREFLIALVTCFTDKQSQMLLSCNLAPHFKEITVQIVPLYPKCNYFCSLKFD